MNWTLMVAGDRNRIIARFSRSLHSRFRWRTALGSGGALAILALSAICAAQTLTGKVTNRTTNRSAAGDEVVLLSLRQGMEEAGRTTTDAQGNFSLKLDDATAPHLLRAIHQDVTYHRMAPPGTTSVELEVYDVAKKLDAISVTADVMRIQAETGTLQIVRRFSINNSSTPPRTQMNDHNFEFYLPEGAHLESGMAKSGNAQPINSDPVPQKEKNRYAFVFPLRPGETQFQVAFQVPYTADATIDPKALYASQHVVVMLPKSMQFAPGPGSQFQIMQDAKQSDTTVQVATNVQIGQPLSFRISGLGKLPATESGLDSTTEVDSMSGGRDTRPGGGLGPPGDSPDPLERYRWYIFGGFVILLGSLAAYVTRRSKHASAGGAAHNVEPAGVVADPNSFPVRGSRLLEVLKDELFDLEVEHKQGSISQQEYEKAKAALDQTLERAIKRGAKP